MPSDYFESLNSMLIAYRSLIRSSLMFCKRYNRLSSSIKRTIDTWAHPMYVTSYVKLLSLQKKELEELVEKEANRNALTRGMELEHAGRGVDGEEKVKEEEKWESGRKESQQRREKVEGEMEEEGGEKLENAGELQRKFTSLKLEKTAKKEAELSASKLDDSSIKLENEVAEAMQFEKQIQSLLEQKMLDKRRSSRLAFKKEECPVKKEEVNEPRAMEEEKQEPKAEPKVKEESKDAHFLGLQSQMLPEFLTKRISREKSDNDYIANLSRLNREYLRGPYKSYTVEEKMHAVSMFVNEFKTITEISKQLNIPCKNIKRWACEGISQKRGGGRRKTCPEVERDTYSWIIHTFSEEDEIQSCWIQQYALRQSKDPHFKASRGWLLNFLDRYDIRRTYTII